jgi:hypothetical protein
MTSRVQKLSATNLDPRDPRPNMSVNTDFSFPYRNFGPIAASRYRDFTTHDAKRSDFQFLIPSVTKLRYDLVALLQPHVLAT